MRKKLSPLPRYSLIVFSLLAIFFSCKKNNLSEKEVESKNKLTLQAKMGTQAVSMSSGCVEDQDAGNGYDSLPRPTILGYHLQNNPYSVANMQQASINLYGNANGITENKWYVRFKPANPQQLGILDDMNLDLFDYPLDYEVLQEGDYYDDGVTPAEEIPWLYAVVDAGFTPPSGIQYELLQRLHVPVLGDLEAEAFRITGNPVDDTTCSSASFTNKASTETVTPNYVPQCGPNEHWDNLLRQCVPNGCPLGYHSNGSSCVPDAQPPAPSPTRQPSGVVQVFDNNIHQNVPVRNIRVIAKNFLKVERTFTNTQGQYFINKEFRKVNIYVRTKNDQATIRSLRRARLWQMLFPVEHHFGKFRGPLNNIQHTIPENLDALSDGARDWAAASAHNNVQEYYAYATQFGIGTPPSGLKVLLTNWRTQGVRGATPMYAKRVIQELPEDFLRFYVIVPSASITPWLYVLKTEIDVTTGYNRFDPNTNIDRTATSDQLGETMFHELTHAAHYNKVGNAWWNDFVDGELNNIIWHSGDNPPYGLGNQGAISDIIALGESWAYHMGHFLSDQKYALNSSDANNGQFTYTNGNPIPGFSSHINALEDFSPDRPADPDRWIPIGLYYDLFDIRNEINNPITDGVLNFTNQQLFNALDPDIRTMLQYRDRLVGENPNNQTVQVRDLFTQYHIQ